MTDNKHITNALVQQINKRIFRFPDGRVVNARLKKYASGEIRGEVILFKHQNGAILKIAGLSAADVNRVKWSNNVWGSYRVDDHWEQLYKGKTYHIDVGPNVQRDFLSYLGLTPLLPD